MNLNRRDFIAAGAAIGAAGMLSGLGPQTTTAFAQNANPEKAAYKTHLYKAWIAGVPTEKLCEQLKNAGYAGYETNFWKVDPKFAAQGRKIAESFDLRIHSVMRGWAEFNNKDEAIAKKSIEDTKTAIRAAATYGADAILLVPCRVGGSMPEPWDFKYEFDPKTLKVKSVTEGDPSKFVEHIEIQNYSTEASIKAIEELIPLAAKEGVAIALENVWNNLWVMPDFFAAFVRYFDNHWVKAYLDLGNHTRYAAPEHWLKALGNTIVKLHIKGYKITDPLNPLGGGKGNWSAIDQASIDWQSVRRTIDEINFNGWISVEEGNYPLEKYSEILDGIIG